MKNQSELTQQTLMDLSSCLSEKTGIYFPENRWRDLARSIHAAARELNYDDTQAFVEGILSSTLPGSELEILTSHITIGETYFFREPAVLEILEQHILAKLIRERRGKNQNLRIWCAGCATGEEPYSIAIVLNKLLPDIADWNITLLATDINPRFLARAKAGIYTEWSFRGVPAWIRDKYFNTDAGGNLQIVPGIKKMVTFSHLNLAEQTYPSLINGTNAMDVILCRNVLMYFKPERMKEIVEKLRLCLVDRGWLTVSSVETSNVLFAGYESTVMGGFTFYRRSGPRLNPESARPCADYSRPVPDPVSMDACSPAMPENRVAVPVPADAPVCSRPKADSYQQAHELFLAGKYDEATVLVLDGIKNGNVSAMKLMARILANQGKLKEAAEWCGQAINNDKVDAGCYYLLATIHQERGMIDDAVKALKQGLYLNPRMILAHFALGNLARIQERISDSNKHFENALLQLAHYQPDTVLDDSEGMTAGHLGRIIEALLYQGEAA